MGRPRGFDELAVISVAGGLFLKHGYEATSIDDLVVASGLHRGSLYKAFGSKRGVFLSVLQRLVHDCMPAMAAELEDPLNEDTLDLLLVAALELAPNDDEVRELVERACALLAKGAHGSGSAEPSIVLGRRLLQRAGVWTPQLN